MFSLVRALIIHSEETRSSHLASFPIFFFFFFVVCSSDPAFNWTPISIWSDAFNSGTKDTWANQRQLTPPPQQHQQHQQQQRRRLCGKKTLITTILDGCGSGASWPRGCGFESSYQLIFLLSTCCSKLFCVQRNNWMEKRIFVSLRPRRA